MGGENMQHWNACLQNEMNVLYNHGNKVIKNRSKMEDNKENVIYYIIES